MFARPTILSASAHGEVVERLEGPKHSGAELFWRATTAMGKKTKYARTLMGDRRAYYVGGGNSCTRAVCRDLS